jgi:hypothetical protein
MSDPNPTFVGLSTGGLLQLFFLSVGVGVLSVCLLALVVLVAISLLLVVVFFLRKRRQSEMIYAQYSLANIGETDIEHSFDDDIFATIELDDHISESPYLAV